MARETSGDRAVSSVISDLKTSLASDDGSSTSCATRLRQLLDEADAQTSLCQKPGSRAQDLRNTTTTGPWKVSGPSLSAKQKRALATDIANLTLKLLGARSTTSHTRHGDRERSRKPLGSLSENIGSSPAKDVKGRIATNGDVSKVSSSQSVSQVAECCQISFAYLRSSGEEPHARVCDGSLVLCGRLLACERFDLAIAELQAIKRMLVVTATSRGITQPSQSARRCERKEALTELLQLNISNPSDSDMLRRAIIYQNLVLRLLAQHDEPASMELLLEYMRDSRNSPTTLIQKYMALTKDKAKAASYLESLSSALLALTSLDAEGTRNSEMTTSERATTFRLHTIALQTCQEWWRLAGHKGDMEKLARSFLRSMKSFLKSTDTIVEAPLVYKVVTECYSLFDQGKHESSSAALYELHCCVYNLSRQASKAGDMAKWLGRIEDHVRYLPDHHARHLLIHVFHLSDSLTQEDTISNIERLASALRNTVRGDILDYETLLQALHGLLQKLSEHRGSASPDVVKSLVASALHFSQCVWEQHPKHSSTVVYDILHLALRSNLGHALLSRSLRKSSVSMLVSMGTLKIVAEQASFGALETAWMYNRKTIMLGQIIKILTMRSLCPQDTGIEAFFEISTESPLETALVLEWQLHVLLRQNGSKKLKSSLNKFIPLLFSKLSVLYSDEQHPIRRRLMSMQAFLAHDSRWLSNEELDEWLATEDLPTDIGSDQSLSGYTADVTACLEILLYQRWPASTSSQHLEKALELWQMIVNQDRAMREQQFYDIETSLRLLESVAAYQLAMGLDTLRVRTLTLMLSIELYNGRPLQSCSATSMLATQLHCIGRETEAAKLFNLLAATQSLEGDPTPSKLQVLSRLAEARLHSLQMGDCRQCIDDISRIGSGATAKISSLTDTVGTLQSCARVWQVKSQLSLYDGSTREALLAAKQAVKAVNSAWHRIDDVNDRLQNTHATDYTSDSTSSIVAGVGKLNLKPDGLEKKGRPGVRSGALYWSLVACSCIALMHLSDIYAHLGDFANADVYSKRSLDIAHGLSGSRWGMRVRAHRAALMTKAGKLEEAELLLAKNEASSLEGCSALAHHFMTLALLRTESGDFREALEHIQKAEKTVQRLHAASQPLVDSLLAIFVHSQASSSFTARSQSHAIGTIKQQPMTRAIASADRRPTTRSSQGQQRIGESKMAASSEQCSDLAAEITVHKATILQRAGQNAGVEQAGRTSFIRWVLSQQIGQVHHRKLLTQIDACTKQDLRLNALCETVVAFPAQAEGDLMPATDRNSVSKRRSKTRSTGKKAQSSERVDHQLGSLLQSVREKLPLEGMNESLVAMADLRNEKSCIIEARVYEQACGPQHPAHEMTATSVSWLTEYASLAAYMRQRHALMSQPRTSTRELSWPQESCRMDELPSQSLFQSDYIDIIPQPWTVVSLHLDSAGTRLQVSQYRSGRSPVVVSLPFARHETEHPEEEPFDYQAARVELLDIIESSNRSCHAGTKPEQKGHKADWWRERESLDRRLGSLLTSIQSQWLGGFKGLLSTRRASVDITDSLRVKVNSILNGHLSTSVQSWRTRSLCWGEETFVQMLNDLITVEAKIEEAEDAVLDLVYFLLDTIRLHGVDIVYDEVDFDSMVVELCEAMTEYRKTYDSVSETDSHLVLILDNRLQIFPWESMPCLDGVSTSRVSSMQSLRCQILKMRTQCGLEDDKPSIAYHSGTILLNPASDLAQTEATLMPALSSLQAEKPDWKILAKQIPTEDEFASGLKESSIFLYFGHGSGAQYIRPQAVRRLQQCSEVVWLMGCSSGAVHEHGSFEPSSIPFSYLLVGAAEGDQLSSADHVGSKKCLAVLANLWDVTDKDIDRFSIAVGEEWGLWPRTSCDVPKQAQNRSRQKSSQPVSTPVGSISKPSNTKHPIHQSGQLEIVRERKMEAKHSPVGLAKAVSSSRDTCFLRYLNGAAPVVYGVPVYLDK